MVFVMTLSIIGNVILTMGTVAGEIPSKPIAWFAYVVQKFQKQPKTMTWRRQKISLLRKPNKYLFRTIVCQKFWMNKLLHGKTHQIRQRIGYGRRSHPIDKCLLFRLLTTSEYLYFYITILDKSLTNVLFVG